MCPTVPDAIVYVSVQLWYQFIWVRQCWKIWLHCCCLGNMAKNWLCHCHFRGNRKKTKMQWRESMSKHHFMCIILTHCTWWSAPSLTHILVIKFNKSYGLFISNNIIDASEVTTDTTWKKVKNFKVCNLEKGGKKVTIPYKYLYCAKCNFRSCVTFW